MKLLNALLIAVVYSISGMAMEIKDHNYDLSEDDVYIPVNEADLCHNKKSDTEQPKPFKSEILSERHNEAETNQKDGISKSRGEGLPYSDTPSK